MTKRKGYVLLFSVFLATVGFCVIKDAVFFAKNVPQWVNYFPYQFAPAQLVVLIALIPLLVLRKSAFEFLKLCFWFSLLLPVVSILLCAMDWGQPVPSFFVNYLWVLINEVLPVTLGFVVLYALVARVKT